MEHFIINTKAINGLSDDQFFNLCADNRDVKFERNANQDIIIMSPTGYETGKLNSEINRQLANWNIMAGLGETFDSSTGFTLPDKAVRSPDAAWISNERIKKIPLDELKKFPKICPDFIIELISPSDNLKTLKEKMKEWIENGCNLAWLIEPENETVHVYHPGGTIDKIIGFDKSVSGENILPGFELQLSLLRS